MTEDVPPLPAAPRQAAERRASFMFEATLDDVARVAQALRVFLPAEVGEEAKNEIEIGVVEAMTNIVRHSYGEGHPGFIEISYNFSNGLIVIELTDHGKPMAEDLQLHADTEAFDFDPADIAHLPESGMGLALMRATFDRIAYRRGENVNTLRMEKAVISG
ncbi:ATP-binding protein [Noviherbaspirillum pedocola]|uniref:ATP-binding protein n=1 Tax=Noviherbaspirillum pedocola TaxID=2801341 RepID=A0A934SRS7_9BURK|nr:ATP-binding protein [Noviherbaspirillum pedocola]MBK4735405.1 ATP-binding protein [Noviherbaspirillum pedocola]